MVRMIARKAVPSRVYRGGDQALPADPHRTTWEAAARVNARTGFPEMDYSFYQRRFLMLEHRRQQEGD